MRAFLFIFNSVLIYFYYSNKMPQIKQFISSADLQFIFIKAIGSGSKHPHVCFLSRGIESAYYHALMYSSMRRASHTDIAQERKPRP